MMITSSLRIPFSTPSEPPRPTSPTNKQTNFVMELLAHALSSVASLSAIGATLLGGAAIAGKVPRAGPLRALALGA